MLTFFRRIIYSPIGAIVTLLVLGLIALLFAASDVSGLRSAGVSNLFGSKSVVATIGGEAISADDFKRRVQTDIENYRQQQPSLTIQQYADGGGLDGSLNQMIDGLMLDKFAERAGMAVSKKEIDARIAQIPGLQGLNGKFDQTKYDQLLAQRRLTDAEVRRELRRSILFQQLSLPSLSASQVPQKLATPYAALLLEHRVGQVGIVPARAMGAGTLPTAGELKSFYDRNRARYAIPERRVIRYAIVSPETVKAQATPTQAEIAAAYRQQSARFAASEKRGFTQVVVADQAAANALAAKVKSGTPIDAAAKAIGLDAAKIVPIDRAGYQAQSNAETTAALFSVARGAIAGPVHAPLGWVVARVDSIEKIEAKTLDQARAELAAELGRDKAKRVLADLNATIDEAINKNASFADVVAAQKLAVATTPALTAEGRDPNGGSPPDPMLAPILKSGFSAQSGDDAQIIPFGADGGFAVVALDKILPSVIPPLSAIRDVIARDFTIDRANRAARKVAAAIVDKVNHGMALSDALKASGVALPPPSPLDASRAALAANPQRVPAAVALAFTMAPKRAKLIEAPEQGGWLIVYLDKIDRVDARGHPDVITAEQRDLGRALGREYVQQLLAAMRRDIKVVRHEDVIAKVRADLLGQSAGGQ